MKKRTKIIILAVMVVLLGVTGYLNVMLNNSVKKEDVPTQATTLSYFASYRQNRENRRDEELMYYKALAESPNSDAETVANANAAYLNLVELMDTELEVEGMIQGLGFNDCVISMSSSKVNVLVDAAVLTEDEVIKIVDVVQQFLGTELRNIAVIPVE